MSRQPALRALAVILLLVAAGCGDDDSASDAPARPGDPAPSSDGPRDEPDGLEIIALDIDFDEDAYETDAGEVDVRYVNEGNIYHTLVIEDVGGFELAVRSTGDVDDGSVDLSTGEYVLYCDVPGHRQAGMVADLTVT